MSLTSRSTKLSHAPSVVDHGRRGESAKLCGGEPRPDGLFLTLSLQQLLRRNPHDLPVAPDDDGIAGPGVILNRFSHSVLQGLLGLDIDQADAPLQTSVLSHRLTPS